MIIHLLMHDIIATGAAKGDSGVILAIGDSITQGVPYVQPGQTYPDLLEMILGRKVINIGVGGLTVAEMEMDLVGDMEKYRPSAIVLSGGGNDIDYGRSAEDVIGDISAIAQTTMASGAVLVLCTLTPSAYGQDDEESRSEVNSWIRKNERGDWQVADIDGVLHDGLHPSRLAPDMDSGDGVHPNAKGMRAIAEVISRALE